MDRKMFSLIVPTINRDIELKKLFDSLSHSTNMNFEIFVIDQNQDDRVEKIEKMFSNLEITNIKVNFKSATKARNYGIQFATGKYVIFPDDDCEFMPDTLATILEVIEETGADMVTGRCVDRNGNDSVAKFSKKECFVNMKNHQGKYVEVTECFKNEIIKEYMYDEEIGVGNFYGSGEALDQMIRMLQDNIKIYYSPSIQFYHPCKVVNYSRMSEIRRSFFYASGFSYVCRKYHLSYAKKRLLKLIPYIIYCIVLKHSKLNYYLAELAGLLSGFILDDVKMKNI